MVFDLHRQREYRGQAGENLRDAVPALDLIRSEDELVTAPAGQESCLRVTLLRRMPMVCR